MGCGGLSASKPSCMEFEFFFRSQTSVKITKIEDSCETIPNCPNPHPPDWVAWYWDWLSCKSSTRRDQLRIFQIAKMLITDLKTLSYPEFPWRQTSISNWFSASGWCSLVLLWYPSVKLWNSETTNCTRSPTYSLCSKWYPCCAKETFLVEACKIEADSSATPVVLPCPGIWVCWKPLSARQYRHCKAHTSVKNIEPWQSSTASLLYHDSLLHISQWSLYSGCWPIVWSRHSGLPAGSLLQQDHCASYQRCLFPMLHNEKSLQFFCSQGGGGKWT